MTHDNVDISMQQRGHFFYTFTLATFFAASSVPTPLYQIYQQTFGFSPILLTIIFAVYSLSLLLSLLLLGTISDYVGRRPTICAALGVLGVSALLFLMAASPLWLVAARLMQGIAIGIAASSVGAALLDIDPLRGAITNSIAPLCGMAIGALATGALLQYAPYPTYLAHLIVLAVALSLSFGIWTIPETTKRRAGILAALKPKIFVPLHVRERFIKVVPLTIAIWALAGFYLSLVPSLVKETTNNSLPLVGATVVGALTIGGSVMVYLLQNSSSLAALRIGARTMVVGVLLVLIGIHFGSPTLLVLATFIAGIGFGANFLGIVRTILPFASANERAGLLSAFYIVCYLSSSLPSIAAGFLVRIHGFVWTTYVYGAIIILLTLAGTIMLRPEASESK